MPVPTFDKLFEVAALDLFEDMKQSKDVLSFLFNRLPLKYGLSNGVVVNAEKEITTPNLLLIDALNCPKLFLDQTKKMALIPYPYVYGTIAYTPQINQESLDKILQQNNHFFDTNQTQSIDNQENTPPLNIWMAENLAAFISLEDLEDRLLAETNPPDLVLVLNRGLLITLNRHTIEQIIALAQQTNSQSFDKAIAANLVSITEKTLTTKYFKMEASAEYKNLFYFYILLLNLLQHQTLPTTGLSAEMVAIWKL